VLLLDGSIRSRAASKPSCRRGVLFVCNRLIYEKLCELYQKNRRWTSGPGGGAEDVAAAREHWRFAYLTQISSRIPTTAQAQYFIEKVRELYLLRELIKVATGAVENCYTYQGGLEEFIDKVEQTSFG